MDLEAVARNVEVRQRLRLALPQGGGEREDALAPEGILREIVALEVAPAERDAEHADADVCNRVAA